MNKFYLIILIFFFITIINIIYLFINLINKFILIFFIYKHYKLNFK